MPKNEKNAKDEATLDGKAGGAAAGGTTGALIGAVVGGPVGAGVGAVIGAAVGGLTGAAFDDNGAGFAENEEHFRTDYQTRHKAKAAPATYEEAAPAYEYGWKMHNTPEFQGKSFDESKTALAKNWSGKGDWKSHEPLARAAWDRRAQAKVAAGGEAVIPVVEEELHVGKTKKSTGGVRVESHVTETPVQADVHLHEEHVDVKRRPVSRGATGDDMTAFKGGTIEVTESAEEAVVNKKSRVVEEVVVKKAGSDRTETVHDTVRKTNVDVKNVATPVTEEVVTDVEVNKGKGHTKKS